MAFEPATLHKWLYQTLCGDATITGSVALRVYRNKAPQGAIYPYLLYSLQSDVGNNTFGGRALAAPLFQVKAVGKADDPTLPTLATRVDVLLQDTQLTMDGFRIRCQREQTISMPENADGIWYEHMGGLYRCWISAA